MLTPKEIDGITWNLMWQSAIIFYLLLLPFRYYSRKRALKRIKQDLQENEHLVYLPKFSHTVDLLVPLFVGGFLGAFIFPFFMFEEINNLNTVNRTNLPLWIIAEIVGILAVLLFSATQVIITNQKITYTYAYKFIYKFAKTTKLNISNIDYSEIKWHLFLKSLDIWFKDGSYFSFIGFKNLEEMKYAIDSNIVFIKE